MFYICDYQKEKSLKIEELFNPTPYIIPDRNMLLT